MEEEEEAETRRKELKNRSQFQGRSDRRRPVLGPVWRLAQQRAILVWGPVKPVQAGPRAGSTDLPTG